METTFIPSGITFWTWARLWVNIHLTCLWTPPSSTLTKLKSLSGFIALGRSLDIEVKTQSSKSMKGCNDGFQNNFFRMHSQGCLETWEKPKVKLGPCSTKFLIERASQPYNNLQILRAGCFPHSFHPWSSAWRPTSKAMLRAQEFKGSRIVFTLQLVTRAATS